jgi:hypothetical protein
MPNADRDNDDVTTKSNPALTDDCEGKLGLSPRAAAAEMARSPVVHVMESAVAVPINDYKALPVLALDDPDFPNELRGFGVFDGVPMLEWRQCPWNPDVLLAIVPGDAGVFVYHRWDGFGVSDDGMFSDPVSVGMMDLRLTLNGAGQLGFNQPDLIKMPRAEAMRIDLSGRSVFSHAAIVGEVFTGVMDDQRQEYAGSDLLYAVLLKVGVLRQPWGMFLNLFTEANYIEVSEWGLSAEQQKTLDAYRNNRGTPA